MAIIGMMAAMAAVMFGVVVSCDKEADDQIVINGYKLAKGVTVNNTADDAYSTVDVKAKLRDLMEGQRPDPAEEETSLDSLCGVIHHHVTNITYFGNGMQREIGVGLYLTPCAGAPIMSNEVNVRAISIVINYGVTDGILQPFDVTKVNPGLYQALSSGLGALLTNAVNGRFYFAWYCIAPITISTAGASNDLFKLDFANCSPQGYTMLFDNSVPENLSVSSNGWDELQIILTPGQY